MRRCFVFVSPATADGSISPRRKASMRRKSATSSSPLNRKSISFSWSSLKSYFTRKNHRSPATAAVSASPHRSPPPPVPCQNASGDREIRTGVPCTACSEIIPKRQLLDHQEHAVSELSGEDSGHNVVKIIFTTSWANKRRKVIIHRILKIHNSNSILSRFEDYREAVKSKAAARISVGGGGRRADARCIADGNEMLRFHCSTFMCGLGQDGNFTLCNSQFCSVCGIIRSGFSAKLDGISTLATSWRAHVAIPDETMEEFGFMHVKRAMLICRVVAGRVGEDVGGAGREGVGFDSVTGRVGDGVDDEELVVSNPMAVLPCFVVVYTVTV